MSKSNGDSLMMVGPFGLTVMTQAPSISTTGSIPRVRAM